MISIQKITATKHMEQAFEIRRIVFVVEQRVDPKEEYDEFETASTHFLATYNITPVGTARYRKTEKGIKLERFAVMQDFRGKGVGKDLVLATLKDIEESTEKIYLHAQIQVIGFYEKLGFVAEGEIFDEAGIQHRIMYFQK
ncbi:MAG: GNAT family N-acetyltransferase [Bacteroidetes bacterium]|nr:GNAT family N-acetyltransferase [Bacteroidota bacterium]